MIRIQNVITEKRILILKQNFPASAIKNQQGAVSHYMLFSLLGSPESEEVWGDEVKVLRVCRAHRRKMSI